MRVKYSKSRKKLEENLNKMKVVILHSRLVKLMKELNVTKFNKYLGNH